MSSYSSDIDKIIDKVIEVEGERYTNDPTDAGGPTKWGITLKALSNFRGRACTPQDVQALSRQEAFQIYRQEYVDKPKFNLIEAHSVAVAAEVVDTGVNMGPAWGGKFLQRALNALNNTGAWPSLVVDGQVGPATAGALKTFLSIRGKAGEYVLLTALNALQGARYVELTEANTPQRRFFYGWLDHRVGAQMKDYIKAGG